MGKMLDQMIPQKSIIIDSNGATIEELRELNNLIPYDNNIKLILSCDYTVSVSDGKVNNLDVLYYLNKISRVVVFNYSSLPLSNIDNIKYVVSIKEFELGGFLKRNINLEVLSKYDIEFLDLELNATPKIYKLISGYKNLKVLRINSLDLSRLHENGLVELEIRKTLKNEALLKYKTSCLNTLCLSNIRSINDFSFISPLKQLRNLSLRNTPIISFPPLGVNNIERIELIKNTRLVDISSIVRLGGLDKLFISLCDKIPLSMLEECVSIKGLKQFYLLTARKKTNCVIKKLLEESNISKDSNGFWE